MGTGGEMCEAGVRAKCLKVGLLDYGKKIIIKIIQVNIETTIIRTIIFEFENVWYLFSMSKKNLVTENRNTL